MNNSYRKVVEGLQTTSDVLVSNVFEDLHLSKTSKLEMTDVSKVISAMGYILKGNKMLSIEISKEDLEEYSTEYDFETLRSWFAQRVISGKLDHNNLQSEISKSFNQYYDWKNKVLSREKSLEKNSLKPINDDNKVKENTSKTEEKEEAKTSKMMTFIKESISSSKKDKKEVKESSSKEKLKTTSETTEESTEKVEKDESENSIDIWDIEDFDKNLTEFDIKEEDITDKLFSFIENESKPLVKEYAKQAKNIFTDIIELFDKEDNKNLNEIQCFDLLNNKLKKIDFDRLLNLTKDLIDGFEAICSSSLCNTITLVLRNKPQFKDCFKNILKTILNFYDKTTKINSPLIKAIGEELIHILKPIAKILEVEIKELPKKDESVILTSKDLVKRLDSKVNTTKDSLVKSLENVITEKIAPMISSDIRDKEIKRLKDSYIELISEFSNSENPITKVVGKELEIDLKPLFDVLDSMISIKEEKLNLPTLDDIKKDFKESLERFTKILRKEFQDTKITWNQCKYYFDTYNSKLLYNSIIEPELDDQFVYNKIIDDIYNSGLEEVKEFNGKNSKTSRIMAFMKMKSSKSEDNKKEVKESSSKEKPKTTSETTEESTEKVEKLEDDVENALEAYNTESSTTSETTEQSTEEKETEDKVIEKRIILHYPIDPSKMMSDEEINLFNEFMEVEGSINGTKPETVNYLHNKAAKIEELFSYLSEDDKYLVPYHLNINEIFEESKIVVKDITNDKVIVEALVKGINTYANNKRNSAPQLSKLGMQIAEFETLLTGKDLPILNL